jgi:hypothetical protein
MAAPDAKKRVALCNGATRLIVTEAGSTVDFDRTSCGTLTGTSL